MAFIVIKASGEKLYADKRSYKSLLILLKKIMKKNYQHHKKYLTWTRQDRSFFEDVFLGDIWPQMGRLLHLV